MIPIEKSKGITKGEELAKVLWYYNLIDSPNSLTQKIVCPFHNDVNPSMIVDFENGSWYCFGCGLSGDAAKFVMRMEKDLNELKSLIKLQKIIRSDKCSSIHISHSHKLRKPPKRQFYVEAYDYYHGLSKVNWNTPSISEEQYCKEYMKARGFTSKALMKAKAKVTFNKSYPIIFPMLDNGKFKGWVCRTTLREVEKRRKYLYNEGFSRATTLVGSYGVKDYVFIVEGYMDRLKFVQFGEENVVAILGWKMSDEQIKKLKNVGVTKVISALDNDECGRKGTKYLRKFFDVTRFCYLKGVKDPGEMTKETFAKMHNKTMQAFRRNTNGPD